MGGWIGWAAAVLWAAPNTLIGLALGGIGLVTGGRLQRRGRVLEFWGGALPWLLEHAVPLGHGALAITFGHTVLGRTARDLDYCRSHEMVHVRQYERWGPAFLPAYLTSSLIAWLRGKNAYLDNRFEREAFDLTEND